MLSGELFMPLCFKRLPVLLLSMIAFVLLCAGTWRSWPQMALCAALSLFALGCLCSSQTDATPSSRYATLAGHGISVVLLLFLAYRFYVGLCAGYEPVWFAPSLPALPFPVLLPLLAVAYPFLDSLCCALIRSSRHGAAIGSDLACPKAYYGYGILGAALILCVCSQSSVLYPLNFWTDANCFLSVGHAMLDGQVLYRDIYEQKGPILYALHALAYWLTPGSFLAVWLLEVVCGALSLILIFKITARFVAPEKYPLLLLLLPIAGALIYSSVSFQYGDSVEELCLPIFLYCLDLALQEYLFDKKLRFLDWFVVGLLSAVVLWSKYTLLGLFVGIFFLPLLSRLTCGDPKQPISSLLGILLGVSVVTAPVLLYFVWHGALGSLFEVYFYQNLTNYAVTDSSASWFSRLAGIGRNVFQGVSWLIQADTILAVVLFLGGCFALGYPKKKLALLLGVSLAFSSLFIYFGSTRHRYYAFAFYAFMPLALASVLTWLPRLRPRKVGLVLSLAASCLLCVVAAPGKDLLLVSKESLPQYQLAKTIKRVPDATLLTYGTMDAGFYTTTDITPSFKYFCQTNSLLPEMASEQARYIEMGYCDFYLTCNEPYPAEGYTLVDESEMPGVAHWYLYANNDILPLPDDESSVKSAPLASIS